MSKTIQPRFEDELNNDYEYHHFQQDIPPSVEFHNHDFYELYFFIDGSVTYCIEEKTYELMSGDMLIIPPGKLHKPYISSNLKYERAVLWLKREFFRSLDMSSPSVADEMLKLMDEGHFLVSLRGKEQKKIFSVLSEIDSEISLGDSSEKAAVSSCITLLLINLVRIAKSQPNNESSFLSESIVPSVIEYINAHISEPLSSQSIAEEFFVSKYYLHHIFKSYTNVSLYDYIIAKRIIFAKSLIRHGKNLTDACFACGFKDYSAFYKAFVSKTGISPKEFKNSLKTTKS